MNCCRLCRVSGKVQGVFFRASTQQQARQFGVGGWVRNCDDGSVEVLVCGNQTQVDALCDWLWKGPRSAVVADVVCRPQAWQPLDEFEVR